jgi:hypothetical protein
MHAHSVTHLQHDNALPEGHLRPEDDKDDSSSRSLDEQLSTRPEVRMVAPVPAKWGI